MNENRQQETLFLARQLIRERSYSGEEQGVAAALQAYAEKAGFDDVTVDRYGNVIARIKGSRPGRRILFDGHIDTVKVREEEWSVPPFEGLVRDGRLYGRGASDMKGAVAAFFTAARYFAEDVKRDFAGEICLAAVVHEECFEGVAARSISELVKPDVVVICEASEMNLKYGQRGRAEVVVETFGKPAHSANPEKGYNAVYAMSELIGRIRTLEPPVHPKLGRGILELTDVISAPYPGASVVPSYCRATFDRRLLVDETPEGVLEPVRALIAGMEREDPQFSAKVSLAHGSETCYTGETIEGDRFFPGWLIAEDAPLLTAVVAEMEAIGHHPQMTQYNFCTNGSHYAGEKHIPTIGFGPSRENLAHTIDEYVELEELYRAAECYQAICKALLQ